MRNPLLLLIVVFLVACVPPTSGKPASAVEIPFSGDARSAYATVLRSVVNSDLTVELKDVDAGIVQTEWHNSGMFSSGLGFQHRRIRFKIIVQGDRCRVKPQLQSQGEFGGTRTDWGEYAGEMSPLENDVFEKLIGGLRSDLPAAAAVASEPAAPVATPTPQAIAAMSAPVPPSVASPVLQRPAEPGPLFLKTQTAGLQEVAAGRKVKLSLENGSTLIGTIKFVSKDGVVLDLGGSGEMVVWAKDISQVSKSN